MKASFVDLRKKSGEILRALERNERVTLYYRGRAKGIIQPVRGGEEPSGRAQDHPAFGMWADRADLEDVGAYVRKLRQGRLKAR